MKFPTIQKLTEVVDEFSARHVESAINKVAEKIRRDPSIVIQELEQLLMLVKRLTHGMFTLDFPDSKYRDNDVDLIDGIENLIEAVRDGEEIEEVFYFLKMYATFAKSQYDMKAAIDILRRDFNFAKSASDIGREVEDELDFD